MLHLCQALDDFRQHLGAFAKWTVDHEFVIGEENVERYINDRNLTHQFVAHTLSSESPLQSGEGKSAAGRVFHIQSSPGENLAIEH